MPRKLDEFNDDLNCRRYRVVLNANNIPVVETEQGADAMGMSSWVVVQGPDCQRVLSLCALRVAAGVATP